MTSAAIMRTFNATATSLAAILCGSAIVAGASDAGGVANQELRPPIIDVHLHAFPIDLYGPGFVAPSPGVREFRFGVPATDAENLELTLAAMREHNIVKAIVSGRLDRTREWVEADPQRLIPGINLGDPVAGHTLDEVPPQSVAAEHAAGRLMVLGEVTTQYASPSCQ